MSYFYSGQLYQYVRAQDGAALTLDVSSSLNRTGLDALTFGLLWCFVFSVPFETSLMISGFGTISRLFGVAVMPVAILAMLARGWVRQLSIVHWCMTAFVLWSSLSYFWSVSPLRTRDKILTEGQLLIVAIMIWQFCTSESGRLALTKAYIYGTLVSCASTIYRYAAHQYTSYDRFSAQGLDPNDLSLTLALSIPFSYYLFLRKRNVWGWLWLVQIGFATMTCFLTASRTGAVVLILAFSIVIFTVKELPAKQRLGMSILFAIAIAICVSFIPSTSWKRIATIGTEVSQGTLNRRTEVWAGGITALGKKPIFGVGAGAFPVAVEPLLSYFDVGHALVAHNTYLSVVTELGVFGLIIFLILLGLLVSIVIRMDPLTRTTYAVACFVWFVGVSVLTWEHRKPTWVLFALIAQALGNTTVFAPEPEIGAIAVTPGNRFMRAFES
jgi:O-antigen ligase